MGKILDMKSIQKHDKYFQYPTNSNDLSYQTADIGIATALTVDRIDLNGVSHIKYIVKETAGVNAIPTFEMTINFYTDAGKEILEAKQIIDIPQVIASGQQIVYIANDSVSLSSGATHCKISYTLPYSSDYSIDQAFEIGMNEEKNENVFTPKWDTLFNGSAVSGGVINKVGNISASGGLSLLVGAVGAAAPGDNVTFSFYLDREQTMKYGSDVVVAIPTTADGTADSIAVSFSDFDKVVSYKATATITSTAGLTDLRVYLSKTQLV